MARVSLHPVATWAKFQWPLSLLLVSTENVQSQIVIQILEIHFKNFILPERFCDEAAIVLI